MINRLLLVLPATLALSLTFASAASLTVVSAKLTAFTSCTLDSASGGIDDAYTQQDVPTTTHDLTVLDVNSDKQSKNQYAWIMFGSLLSSCPKLTGANVASATLTLVMTIAPARAKTYTVSRVDPSATWSEGTLTWNNQPGVTSTTTTFASGTITGTRTIDVTSDVSAFAAGTANRGWRIADLGTGTSDLGVFASAEFATTASRPKLTITYVD